MLYLPVCHRFLRFQVDLWVLVLPTIVIYSLSTLKYMKTIGHETSLPEDTGPPHVPFPVFIGRTFHF